MPNLNEMHRKAMDAHAAFVQTIADHFPGNEEWHWYRALTAVSGKDGRRNDDTSNDVALAADETIRARFDEYLKLLHEFYRARDGAHGVLGGRGL